LIGGLKAKYPDGVRSWKIVEEKLLELGRHNWFWTVWPLKAAVQDLTLCC